MLSYIQDLLNIAIEKTSLGVFEFSIGIGHYSLFGVINYLAF